MIELIKKIRNQTGAGVVDIKKALDEAQGSEDKAIEILRKKGLEKAGKKGDREAKEGIITSYVHTDGKTAAMVKVLCETDFVARTEEFKQLARDLAMQVVAMNPLAVKPENVSQELIDQQKTVWIEELATENKPKDVVEKIMQGKEEKLRSQNSLLGQAFIKDQDRTVEEVIKEKISQIGENIVVEGFHRMEL